MPNVKSAPKKKKKEEEKVDDPSSDSEPVPKKVKAEKQVAKGKKKEHAQEKKTEAAVGKKNESKTFARRPCPKTSPASDRWIAISQIFKKHVAPKIVALGLYTYSYEDKGATKKSNYHL